VNREYHKWLSPNLGREMELLVFGNCGLRVLVFPTWSGRFYQYEDHGMVKVLRDRLEGGAIQLFCVDSFDSNTLYNNDISSRERILRHLNFEKYILDEVLPFSESKNPNPSLTSHGCSLGAFHAVNIAFRHPNRFNGILALSGRYDLTRSFNGFPDLFDGYYDDDVYFNTPNHFIRNLTDPEMLTQLRRLNITLAVGEADVFLENNRALSQALWDKGIWHAFRVWAGKAHDFHHWREMLRLYA
jgi:esterase/lipase superfamily enzyme